MFVRPNIWKILIAIYFNVINVIYWSQAAAVTASARTAYNCSQPPKFDDFDIGQCCRFPAINLGQAVEKCHQHIKSLKSYNDKYPVYAHVCYPECIYRETNAFKGNDYDNGGDIQLENVQKFLTTNIEQRDKNIVPTILQSFKSCLTNIRQHMQAKGIKAYPKLTELGCSPYASLVYGCVNAETFLQCPPEMWQQQQQSCNLARSFAQQCNPLPHVPMPMI